MDIDNYPYTVLVKRVNFDKLKKELAALSMSYQLDEVRLLSRRNDVEWLSGNILLTSLEDYSFIKMKYS